MNNSRTYISSRNRNLAKLAILNQPSLEETAARPAPAHIPGQLSLFIEEDIVVGNTLTERRYWLPVSVFAEHRLSIERENR